MDGDLGPLDRPQVALPLERLIGQAGVGGVVVGDLVDDDGRGDLHRDPIAAGLAVAGRQVILVILLQAEIARRKSALVAVVARRAASSESA